MDYDKVYHYYDELKKQLFHNEIVLKSKIAIQSTGFSLGRFVVLHMLCKLIETSNNKKDFFYTIGKTHISIKYDDRKLIVVTWTLCTFLLGTKPRIIYTPFTFFLSSMLFWRELYNPFYK